MLRVGSENAGVGFADGMRVSVADMNGVRAGPRPGRRRRWGQLDVSCQTRTLAAQEPDGSSLRS
jgi:hypothetical protein